MNTDLLKKWLAIGIILLFLGTCIIPAGAQKINEIDTSSYDGKQFLESYENYGFGYRLYDSDSQYDPGPVFFKLDDPGTIHTLAYDNNTITGGCYDSSNYTWYVCDDSGNILIIDIWSGDMTLIGGNSESLSALAFDSQTGTMYGAYEDFLYGIDMQTGEILWIWSVAGPTMGYVSGMAADGLGHLYIVDTFDDLYRLDIDTFLVTYIGPLLIDLEGNADLEFDFNTGILYLNGYTTQGALYRIKPLSGNATLIGNYEGGVGISGFIIPWNWPPPYPPEPPQITGLTHGKINIEYEYEFVSTDPEGDDLTYIINWGDGNVEEHGVYPAGDPIIVKHAWSEEETFIIKAKARKLNGLESDWGTLTVTMPCSYNIPFKQFWMKLLERFPNVFPILRQLMRY